MKIDDGSDVTIDFSNGITYQGSVRGGAIEG